MTESLLPLPISTPRSRRIATFAVFAGLFLQLAAGCSGRPAPTREWKASDHGQPVEADPARTPAPVAAPEEGGSERAASALFAVSCAGCHGRDGHGQGPQRPPGAQIPDFSDPAFQAQRTDDQLRLVIQNGRGLMPPFGKQLNDQGLAAMVAHVRRYAAPAQH